MCFFCEEKPRISDDVACRSCLQEHKMCYECGEKERNFPFKLCTACYAATTAAPFAAILPAPSSTKPYHNNIMHIYISLLYLTRTPVCHPPLLTTGKVVARSSRSSNGVLQKLNKDQTTYKEVAEHFKKEWVKTTKEFPDPPLPSAIYAIQNTSLVKQFHRYGDQLRKQGSVSANSDLFFHGTVILCDLLATDQCCSNSDCGICGISQNGFDASKIGTNIPRFKRFGHGIYLAPNSSKCHDYTQGVVKFGVRAQLLCLVACGAQYELRHDNTKLQRPPSEFHSVYGKSGGSLNYDEIVVYDVRAVLPQFVVVYVHNGVHKIAK